MWCIVQYTLFVNAVFFSGFHLKLDTLQYLHYELIISIGAHVVQMYKYVYRSSFIFCMYELSFWSWLSISEFNKCENLGVPRRCYGEIVSR